MGLRQWLIAALKPQDPASLAYEALEKRVTALEEAHDELATENEDVLKRVRTWSAREAAKARHEASKNLDALMAGEGEPEGEIVPPGANGDDSARTTAILDRAQSERMRAKAALARKFRGMA